MAMRRQGHQKAYVVFRGRRPGVYNSWAECHAQVNGFKGCLFQSYNTLDEAQDAWTSYSTNLQQHEVIGHHPPYHGTLTFPTQPTPLCMAISAPSALPLGSDSEGLNSDHGSETSSPACSFNVAIMVATLIFVLLIVFVFFM